MVRSEQDYVFEGPRGEARMGDLFEGRRQLIVQHFMFDPSWDDGCPSCSAVADELSPGLLAPLEINYRSRGELEALEDASPAWALTAPQPVEMPSIGCFLRDGDDVFHTYSTFGRGSEALGGAYAFLDLTALGRQEEWEEPKGRADSARVAMPDFSA